MHRRWRKLVSNDTKIPPPLVPVDALYIRCCMSPVSGEPKAHSHHIACAGLLHSATLGIDIHQLFPQLHRSPGHPAILQPRTLNLKLPSITRCAQHNGPPGQQTHLQVHQRRRPACVLHAADPRPASAQLRGECDARKDRK